jgi:two-component system sensor histidine kinase/response regulator
MAGYITKPVRAQVLKSVLDKWIDGGLVSIVETDKPIPASVSLHYPTLHDIASGDPSLIASLLETFRHMAAESMADMQRSLNAGDGRQLAEQAHKFKSSARTVGALRLGDLCEALERDQIRPGGSAVTALDDIAGELQCVLRHVDERLGTRLAEAG